ncbi:hypothetical protein BCR35DRAFT_305383 [Leucosporidium creatinivorum]|uniref:Uncharacterized protein n=1 Tax=Leucosporidium creatinivorum TaxID=106004 RepID=A0A1Y2F146_9BASI|nr:hypothetical protein BCR35DRAFT_305383 [Leucosporidium creatinivorum]
MLSPESTSSGAPSPFASPHSPIQRLSLPSPQRHRSGYYTSADLYSDSEVILSSQLTHQEHTSLLQRSPSIEPALLLAEQLARVSSAKGGKEKARKKLEAKARFPHPYERGMSWMGGAAADSRGSLPKSLELERAKLMLTNPDDTSSAVNSTTASVTPSRATSLEEPSSSRGA